MQSDSKATTVSTPSSASSVVTIDTVYKPEFMPLEFNNAEELDAYVGACFQKGSLDQVIQSLLLLRLPQDLAARRASIVVEDMNTIGFPINLEMQRGVTKHLHQRGLHIPIHYRIQNTGWSINKKDPRHALEGTHLNLGDLLRLTKVCELGRSLLPNEWPHKFRNQFTNPSEHLDAVNELWWLGRFKNPKNVKKLDLINQNGPSPDWAFSLDCMGTTLNFNVEVKRRCSDLKRHLKITNKTDLFDKVTQKFPHQSLTELNIAAITTFSQIDSAVEEMAQIWIRNEPHLDAVIIWSEQSFGSPVFIHISRHELTHLLDACLTQPDMEDTSGVAVVHHVIQNYPGFPRQG